MKTFKNIFFDSRKFVLVLDEDTQIALNVPTLVGCGADLFQPERPDYILSDLIKALQEINNAN